jgi:von Willebrand factor type A domain/Vault protein inter-alpha-trypsin domain
MAAITAALVAFAVVGSDLRQTLVQPVQSSVWFSATISDATADVTMHQSFSTHLEDLGLSNATEAALITSIPRATYTVPLTDQVSVYAMTADFGEMSIVARVLAKEEAAAKLERAVAENRAAARFEHGASSDLFRLDLGSLPLNATIIVRTSFILQLRSDTSSAHAYRLTIPHTVFPGLSRYFTGAALTPAVLESMENSFRNGAPPAALHFGFLISSPRWTLLEVTSPSHGQALQVLHPTTGSSSSSSGGNNPTAGTTFASLDAGAEDLSAAKEGHKDFHLIIRYEAEEDVRTAERPAVVALLQTAAIAGNVTTVVLEATEQMIATFPAVAALREQHAETGVAQVVFLLDRSGSMVGSRIKKAKEALMLAVRSLPYGTLMQIVYFGSMGYPRNVFPEMVALDEKTMQTALDSLANANADMGGTELAMALDHVVFGWPEEGPTEQQPVSSRSLVLLTDGEVWMSPEELESHRRRFEQREIRVFTFGIGSSVSTAVINGLPTADGHAEFLSDHEPFATKILTGVTMWTRPALLPSSLTTVLEVRNDAGPSSLSLMSRELTGKDLQQCRFVPTVMKHACYAVIPNITTTLAVTVHLLVQHSSNGTVVADVPLSFRALPDGRHLLTAALKEAFGRFYSNNNHNKKGDNEEVRMLELSSAYSVLSPVTAFYAEEEENAPAQTTASGSEETAAAALAEGGSPRRRLRKIFEENKGPASGGNEGLVVSSGFLTLCSGAVGTGKSGEFTVAAAVGTGKSGEFTVAAGETGNVGHALASLKVSTGIASTGVSMSLLVSADGGTSALSSGGIEVSSRPVPSKNDIHGAILGLLGSQNAAGSFSWEDGHLNRIFLLTNSHWQPPRADSSLALADYLMAVPQGAFSCACGKGATTTSISSTCDERGLQITALISAVLHLPGHKVNMTSGICSSDESRLFDLSLGGQGSQEPWFWSAALTKADKWLQSFSCSSGGISSNGSAAAPAARGLPGWAGTAANDTLEASSAWAPLYQKMLCPSH